MFTTFVLERDISGTEFYGQGSSLSFEISPNAVLSDGTGRIQNSDNVPSLNPLNAVDFGEESITDLAFDPGNLTLVAIQSGGGSGGSSALYWWSLMMLLGMAIRTSRL